MKRPKSAKLNKTKEGVNRASLGEGIPLTIYMNGLDSGRKKVYRREVYRIMKGMETINRNDLLVRDARETRGQGRKLMKAKCLRNYRGQRKRLLKTRCLRDIKTQLSLWMHQHLEWPGEGDS